MKKHDEYTPYVVDDTFTISEEVLAMSREERRAALKKYEEEMEKSYFHKEHSINRAG